MAETCKIQGCGKSVRARGLCAAHYNSWWARHHKRPRAAKKRAGGQVGAGGAGRADRIFMAACAVEGADPAVIEAHLKMRWGRDHLKRALNELE